MSDATDFSTHATLPVFPLPEVVFFPHTLLPLHIFEPRYSRMVADAVAGNRHIAMALPRLGRDADAPGRPTIHDIGCMARITREQALDGGRWNIVLVGLSRVRFLFETHARPYRLARVELVRDDSPALPKPLRAALRRRLVDGFLSISDPAEGVAELVGAALRSIEDLGILTDVVASALPLSVPAKQDLIEDPNPVRRAERLLAWLPGARTTTPSQAGSVWPPHPHCN